MAGACKTGLWPGQKICDLKLVCGSSGVARLVSPSRVGWSWRLRGHGRRLVSRSPRTRQQGLQPATRATSQQENVLLFDDRRGDNGALSLEAATVLQGSTLSFVASDAAPQVAALPENRGAAAKTMIQYLEEMIERAIFNCRFFTIMAVCGSLAGSLLCFFKGSMYILDSFREYFICYMSGIRTGKVILLLVEAVDVYLMGTVMLIFGMGVYELFISSLDIAGHNCEGKPAVCGSNLFGLFRLRERPKWLEIRSLDELKTKLGHVIVMILLVGMFEKSKKVPVNSGVDFLCFAAAILMAAGCLFLLSKLHNDGPSSH